MTMPKRDSSEKNSNNSIYEGSVVRKVDLDQVRL